MKNYIQDGEVITVPAPAVVASGDVVQVGSLVGIAQAAAESGADVPIVRRGVFELAKTSAQAWTVGALIYLTPGGVATTVSTANKLVGVAAAAAANPSATGLVLMTGQVS